MKGGLARKKKREIRKSTELLVRRMVEGRQEVERAKQRYLEKARRKRGRDNVG